MYICDDGHQEICFDGRMSDCPACALKQQLNEASGEIDSLKGDKKDLQGRVEGLEGDKSELQDRINGLATELSDRLGENTKLIQENTELRRQIHSVVPHTSIEL